MKNIALIIIFIISITSCNRSDTDSNTNDKTLEIATTDPIMNQIIFEARKSKNDFFSRLLKPSKDERDFSVKYPFKTDFGSKSSIEHLWLEDIIIKNNKYFGVVSNTPESIKRLKLNEVVEFEPEKISDWKYIKKGYLVGGKSIIYLLNNLPIEERKRIVSQLNFKIKEFE